MYSILRILLMRTGFTFAIIKWNIVILVAYMMLHYARRWQNRFKRLLFIFKLHFFDRGNNTTIISLSSTTKNEEAKILSCWIVFLFCHLYICSRLPRKYWLYQNRLGWTFWCVSIQSILLKYWNKTNVNNNFNQRLRTA